MGFISRLGLTNTRIPFESSFQPSAISLSSSLTSFRYISHISFPESCLAVVGVNDVKQYMPFVRRTTIRWGRCMVLHLFPMLMLSRVLSAHCGQPPPTLVGRLLKYTLMNDACQVWRMPLACPVNTSTIEFKLCPDSSTLYAPSTVLLRRIRIIRYVTPLTHTRGHIHIDC